MELQQIGTIKEVRDGIALIEGLPSIMTEEFLAFSSSRQSTIGSQQLTGMALGFAVA